VPKGALNFPSAAPPLPNFPLFNDVTALSHYNIYIFAILSNRYRAGWNASQTGRL
jgi:hypothetical protein